MLRCVQHSTDDKTWVNSSTILDDTNNGRVDYCIEGLEPDTSYYIRVIASNKYGESLIGILSQSEPPKTASRQDMSSNEFDVVGLDIGIVLAILAAVVVGVILYKWRQGKGKEEETYVSIFIPWSIFLVNNTNKFQQVFTVRSTGANVFSGS
ncbi:hypothetical protein LOTGIDRAFT_174464 [Lottia gigantea]|uniref:Fibronectin type-III domain-containing protein n=1 Tax=Lottia gigantea TaxID=225164 RepID=V4AWW9_LOTGI|nr:hypothetical protein LOTGIDRAFT_174464 [Lottia gigantea]ESO98026.1 hypothetical protein LOTGIDRAFT_174464 [Lottia gigantea]